MNSIEELLSLLNTRYIDRPLGITFISDTLTINEAFTLSRAVLRGDLIYLNTPQGGSLAFPASRVDSWYIYGPESLAIILDSGETLTLREVAGLFP